VPKHANHVLLIAFQKDDAIV